MHNVWKYSRMNEQAESNMPINVTAHVMMITDK